MSEAGAGVGDWAETAEGAVLAQAVGRAEALGWSGTLVNAAANAAGLSAADAELLLPEGPRDLAALLFRRHDSVALASLAGTDPARLKMRERIREAVRARVEAAMADEAAVRRSGLFLAWPGNAGLGARLLWDSADALWRWAGDTATDENHYTKRAILSAVLASTVAVRLARGREAADAHLDRRIADVMAFETWKARAPRPSALMTDVAAALGRMRYGARAPPPVEVATPLPADGRVRAEPPSR